MTLAKLKEQLHEVTQEAAVARELKNDAEARRFDTETLDSVNLDAYKELVVLSDRIAELHQKEQNLRAAIAAMTSRARRLDVVLPYLIRTDGSVSDLVQQVHDEIPLASGYQAIRAKVAEILEDPDEGSQALKFVDMLRWENIQKLTRSILDIPESVEL